MKDKFSVKVELKTYNIVKKRNIKIDDLNENKLEVLNKFN